MKKQTNRTSDRPTPEFIAAGRLYSALSKAGRGHTQEGAEAFQRVYDLAPESFRQEMHDMAVQMGLRPPKPDGYTEDGQPIYSLEGIAKRLGISMEEAKQAAQGMGIQPTDSTVHRVN